MKVRFFFSFKDYEIEEIMEYPGHITQKKISEHFKRWLLQNVSAEWHVIGGERRLAYRPEGNEKKSEGLGDHAKKARKKHHSKLRRIAK